jgi:nitrate/TMAO reductase-like tetraheme cytochrome c subunit
VSRQDWIIGGLIAAMVTTVAVLTGAGPGIPPARPVPATDYLRARHNPLHFQPAALQAGDDQCLACHREVLDDRVGAQAAAFPELGKDPETFHRRHLLAPRARQLMDLRCNTCHEGHDPRDEAPGTSATAAPPHLVLRKQVNPETTCLKCHGRLDWRAMGLEGPWPAVRGKHPAGCLECHDKTRTTRHRVSYLNAAAIEADGRKDVESCHTCHGGLAWYRIAYPYPRHPWPGMPAETPAWARDRPGASEPRFARPAGTVGR